MSYRGRVRRLWIIVIVLASLVTLASLALAATRLIDAGSNAGASDGGTSSDTDRPTIVEDEDLGDLEVYQVDEAGDLVPAPAADSLTATVWETFLRVATRDFAAEVLLEYQVGDAPDSDTLAFVYPSDDPAYWVLAANLATSEDQATLVPTLVHEYAHILTLGTEQVGPVSGACPTIELDEGCADEDSTIWAFQERFWSGYTDAPGVDNGDWEVSDPFYAAHEDDFVSDYAAMNVVEDVAETFAVFVMEDRPTGDSVAAQKVEFFWGYPEYVAIRERIRAEFADDLGLVG